MARSFRGGAMRKKRADRARSQPSVSAKAGPERISASETTSGNAPDTPPLVVDAAFFAKAAKIVDSLLDESRALCRDSGSDFEIDWPSLGRDFWNRLAASSGPMSDEDVLRALPSLTKSDNKNVRLCAAHAIMHIGSDSTYWELQEPFGGAALAAMDSDDVAVRDAIVSKLGELAKSFKTEGTAFDIVRRGFKDADYRIRLRCLELLREFEVNQASRAVNDVQALLADQNPEVQRLACDLLGWLGSDADGAIEDLMRCIEDRVFKVRRSAARALAKINPSGDRLPNMDKSLRADLIDLLRYAGADGRALRQSLQLRSTPDNSRNPPPGTENVFPFLTKLERRIVGEIWIRGRPDAVDIGVVGKAVGWNEHQEIRGMLDGHLTRIRKKFADAHTSCPIERARGKVRWMR